MITLDGTRIERPGTLDEIEAVGLKMGEFLTNQIYSGIETFICEQRQNNGLNALGEQALRKGFLRGINSVAR